MSIDTNKQLAEALNKRLVGQQGRAILTVDQSSKLLGECLMVTEAWERDNNGSMLFRFSNNNVIFFAAINTLSITGEKENNHYSMEKHCDDLYFGKLPLSIIVQEIVNNSKES